MNKKKAHVFVLVSNRQGRTKNPIRPTIAAVVDCKVWSASAASTLSGQEEM
jgi:hypothetical protein